MRYPNITAEYEATRYHIIIEDRLGEAVKLLQNVTDEKLNARCGKVGG